MSGIFLISTFDKGISFYWWIICFDQASQYPLSLFFASLSDFANLLAVLRSRKRDSDFGVLFTDPVASFKAFSRNITSRPLKNDYLFLLKSICFHLTGNTYYVCPSSTGILCVYQHWFSILTSLLDRRVLICFVKDILACNLEKDSLYWRISTRTLLFTS